MKFTTHNDLKDGETINTDGTFKVGEIDIAFEDLVKVFGEATDGSDDDKTSAEWEIKFLDDTTATIYNWKNGKNYDQENGLDVEDIKKWNVGGHNGFAYQRVIETLREHKISFK